MPRHKNTKAAVVAKDDEDESTPEDDSEDELTDGEELDEVASPSAEDPSPLSPENYLYAGVVTESRPTRDKEMRMKKHLEAQPKVPIMIPLAMGERIGATHPVILNGYRLNIKKGVYVHVPLQVAQVVMESQQMTDKAINSYFLMNERGVSPAMADKGIIN